METIKHTMFGVEGELTRRAYSAPGRHGIICFAEQKFKARRKFREDGFMKTIIVKVRFDDDCKNGHNTFSITGEIWNPTRPSDCESCGCIHDEITKHFPELAHLIKWHMVSTDGPMHYLSAAYLAGDRDHWGLRKGEAHLGPEHQDHRIRVGDSPIPHKLGNKFTRWLLAELDKPEREGNFMVLEVPYPKKNEHDRDYDPQYSVRGYDVSWGSAPFKTKEEAYAWVACLNKHYTQQGDYLKFDTVPRLFGEGKKRELESARNCAVWPEATDEQLMLPKEELIKLLEARLPALIEDFKANMLACGFEWQVTQ